MGSYVVLSLSLQAGNKQHAARVYAFHHVPLLRVVGEIKSTKLYLMGRAASIFGLKNPYAIFGSETSKALGRLVGERGTLIFYPDVRERVLD